MYRSVTASVLTALLSLAFPVLVSAQSVRAAPAISASSLTVSAPSCKVLRLVSARLNPEESLFAQLPSTLPTRFGVLIVSALAHRAGIVARISNGRFGQVVTVLASPERNGPPSVQLELRVGMAGLTIVNQSGVPVKVSLTVTRGCS